jgi:outer membrane immunogenic protein
MRKILIGAALLSTALATPAFAQESAPFTGPHIEGLVGYDDVSEGEGNVMYGVSGGYDFQLGGVIAGIEGEFADSDVKGTANDLVTTGDSFRLNTDRDLYVGARIGFAVTPSTMLYAKGGYTNAKFEGRFNDGAGTIYNNGVDQAVLSRPNIAIRTTRISTLARMTSISKPTSTAIRQLLA